MSKRADRTEFDAAPGSSPSHTRPIAADNTVKSETSPARKRRASGTASASVPMSGSSSSAAAPAAVGSNEPSMTDSPMGPPPAKKSRTNTPWTPAEEQRLKTMRDAGNSWADIAKTFPARTEGSVKKHWYKLRGYSWGPRKTFAKKQQDMHYAEFAEDESQALLNAIKEYETNKWKEIGKKVGKPAKACEQYAKEHFAGKI
ncbi:putative Myb-like transcription factor-like protein [Leptodontidium sp. MPI-SDFR-AT-0119]|nr:putative Myb-like transcription factor-like protein [Leptodontidium sp. MPI-SDFR-AT-0119]